MPKINFSQGGLKLMPEGVYRVTLEKATDSVTSTKKDMITLVGLVTEVIDVNHDEVDDPSKLLGRRLRRNFVFDNKPDADNGTVIYYLQKALIAFGADEDDVTEDGVDPVKDIIMCEDGIRGNTALARVTHRPDSRNPEVTQADVEFMPEDD